MVAGAQGLCESILVTVLDFQQITQMTHHVICVSSVLLGCYLSCAQALVNVSSVLFAVCIVHLLLCHLLSCVVICGALSVPRKRHLCSEIPKSSTDHKRSPVFYHACAPTSGVLVAC